MQYITEWKGLIGKTITRATERDYGEWACLEFADGDRCVISSRAGYEGDSEVKFWKESDLDNSDMAAAGWMDREEFDRKRAEQARKQAEFIESRERRQLEQLKAKYEPDDTNLPKPPVATPEEIERAAEEMEE
ncbi:MAG: hypothetical protein ACYS76_09635 [Planctomycetota bacterium]|jgi:hypothetical protein